MTNESNYEHSPLQVYVHNKVIQIKDRIKKGHSSSLGDIGARLSRKLGKIPFSGRYHVEPRKITDDYVMSEKICGSGMSGDVRIATSVSMPGQKFAVKSLKLCSNMQSFLRKDKLEQLKAEVENYLSMDHPHIIRLYDVYESRQELFLVMECAEGGELFDRLVEKKRFSEVEASDALRQMLLALNYIHSHGIVHRDVKLENFIYDHRSGGHLKLIDFGFSKMCDPSGHDKMHKSMGTLAYVAPEVLNKSYTSQCDLWSLGVIGFMLLAGYMPFSCKTSETQQMRVICTGNYKMKPEVWQNISPQATNFIKSLLQVDPDVRLTAQQALEHPWLEGSIKDSCQDAGMTPCCEALRKFSRTPKFRRCCLEMLAWSLPLQDRDKVHDWFITLDEHHHGTITLEELKHVMVDKLHLVDEGEVVQVFESLDYNHDQEIHYNDFLAAMVDTQIAINDDAMHDAFRRFDVDGSGYITAEKLEAVLGKKVEGESVEAFIVEADQNKDGAIDFEEFAAYLRGTHDTEDSPGSGGAEGNVRQKSSPPGRRRASMIGILETALKGLKARIHCSPSGSPRPRRRPSTRSKNSTTSKHSGTTASQDSHPETLESDYWEESEESFLIYQPIGADELPMARSRSASFRCIIGDVPRNLSGCSTQAIGHASISSKQVDAAICDSGLPAVAERSRQIVSL